MNRYWRWILPCYLFTVPMTMVGFALAAWVYKARSWAWHDGVLTCVARTHADGSTLIWGSPDAQTLGWLVICASEEARAETDLRVHEYVHVVQAFVSSIVGVTLCPILVALVGWHPAIGLALGGFVGGLGFAILYGLLFFYLFVKNGGGDWVKAYYAIPFEVQAYAAQDKYLADVAAGKDPKPWGV